MPTDTFLHLPTEKRERFIEVALTEFSENNFDTASINKIIKELGIARGSVYQYFTDKLDLWLYLKEYAEGQKVKYIQSVSRNEYPYFWDYYRAIYSAGVNFDLEAPLCSRFLYRIGFKESSKEVAQYLNGWKDKANAMFTVWVEAEKAAGAINKDIPTPIAVHFIVSMSLSIADLLQNKYAVDFDENIRQGKPLFAGNMAEYQSAVNDLIQLLEKALK